MASPPNLPTLWKKGDKFLAAHLNETTEVARRLSSLGGNGIQITQNPTGTVFTVPSPENGGLRTAVLVAVGPNGESDFNDNAYWMVDAVVDGSGTGASSFMPSLQSPDAFKGTNLYESSDGFGVSHLLRPLDGTFPVQYTRGFDDGGNLVCNISVRPNKDLFPVDVVQNGGAAGGTSTACTFTYDVKDKITAAVLGMAIAVEKPRLLMVQMTAATVGAAYWMPSGTNRVVKLWDVGEVMSQVDCT